MTDQPEQDDPKVREAPGRFLHRKLHRNYTDDPYQAVRDEPENLDPDEWDRHIAPTAGRTWEQEKALEHSTHAIDRELLADEARLVDARRRAKLAHVDMSGEFMAVKRLLGRGKDDQARAKLRVIEGRLDVPTRGSEAA